MSQLPERELEAEEPSQTIPQLLTGQHIGAYKIVALIGRGGMDMVYRARDERQRRDVAIKVLPASFANDADRLCRFEQEAHATSALNHPNILTIYDIGKQDGALHRRRIAGGRIVVRAIGVRRIAGAP